ncbi:ParA family partition ATPase [Pseudomonas luteola]|uniref:ParA family partition ATPase n=1 Tax=Pseudomonas luteola TaxID=47886 RepID=UPI0015E38C15|nr:ParA family partition ATPase [Pseudomonas zeshuii]MBA1250898.1 AAA family ATPase [Pseudomonas zeshuii]
MRPKVIAVQNEKGGAGKTTISTNVASCLKAAHGYKVLLIDYDPQGAASNWSAASGLAEDDPRAIPVAVFGKTLARDLPKIWHGFDFVVIDGLPATDEITTAAVKVADLVVIPVQPSQYDIWASQPTIDLVKARQELTDGIPRAAMLISRAIPNTVLEDAVRTSLQATDFPVMKAQTCQRVAYAMGVGKGESVMDLPATDKARAEIEEVTNEILELLK